MLRERDINYFYSSLCEQNRYDSKIVEIQNVEIFLMYWLNGLDCEGKEQFIQSIYNKFKTHFQYKGTMYRGIAINDKEVLKSDYLASFTKDLDIAKEFSFPYKEGQRSIVFQTKTNIAFDFELFLNKIKKKTTNIDLEIVIEERIFEKELLHIFRLNEVQEVKV